MFNITCSVTIRKPLVPLSEALRNSKEILISSWWYLKLPTEVRQRHGTYEVSLIGIVALPEVFS